MPSFGSYEVVDELYRTPFGYVCSARLAGTTTNGRVSDYVVKVYEPVGADGAAPADERGANDFLNRARLQKKLAEDQARHWARIHDLGISEARPFYITDYYPRTAQKLIAGRVILASGALHEIISSIAEGLRELREACRQPHGSLKASNVLIGGSGEVSGAKIVLTDPVCGATEGETEQSGDCHALGMLLYQLVTHRPFRATSWPVEDSEEWSRLGKSATRWRSLCTAMLSPDVTLRPDAEALARSLEALTPRGFGLRRLAGAPGRAVRRVPLKGAAAAAVVLALGTAGAGTYAYARQTATRQTLRQARALWLDPLRSDKAVLARFASLGGQVVGAPDFDALDGFDRPIAMADFTPAAFRRAQAAQAALAQIHTQLLAVYDGSGEKLKSLEARCAHDGYAQAAGYIESLIKLPAPDDAHLIGAIDARLHVADQLAAVPHPAMQPATAAALAALDASGNPDLRTFEAALRAAFLNGATLTPDGWQADAQVDVLARQVAAVKDWPAGYAADQLVRQERIDLQHPTLPVIRQWAGVVGRYAWAPATDQRRAAEQSLAEQLDKADAQVRSDLLRNLAPDDPVLKQYEQERGALRQELAQLSAARFTQGDFPAAFEAQTSRLAEQIRALPGRFHYHPEELAPWLDQMNALSATFHSTSIQSFWRERMAGRTLATVDRAWRQETDALAASLKTYDSAFPLPAPLSDEPWASPTRRMAEVQTTQLLLKRIGPAGVTGDSLAAAKAQFAGWCGEADKLRQEHVDLQHALIDAARLAQHDALWASPDDQTFWKSQVESEAGAFAAVMKADVQRLAAVRRVSGEVGRDALVEAARGAQQPEVVLAAWSTLGRLKQQTFAGTLTPAAMDQWTALLTRVTQSAAAGQLPAAQQAELQDQVRKSGQQMWTSAVQIANSAAMLDAAANAQAALGFDVPAATGLSVLQRYNLALCSALRAKAAKDAGAGARAVRELAAQAVALPDPDRFAVQGFLDQLSKGAGALAAADPQYYLWPADEDKRAKNWQALQASEADRVKSADDDLTNFEPLQALAKLNGLTGTEAAAKRAEIQALIGAAADELKAGDEARRDPQRIGQAPQHYRRAAEGGDITSLVRLGEMNASGNGPLRNLPEAVKCFRAAAAKGNVRAAGDLASVYSSYPIWPDQANAPDVALWFERAADAGNVDAMAGSAQVAMQRRDLAAAAQWLRKANAADADHKDAHLPMVMKRLARAYESQRDPADARVWYEAAAARGDAEAKSWVAAQAGGSRSQPPPPPPPPPPRTGNSLINKDAK